MEEEGYATFDPVLEEVEEISFAFHEFSFSSSHRSEVWLDASICMYDLIDFEALVN
jgi:hypothetical protein